MVLLESNVTPNMTRSTDSFSTVPTIVNGGDWDCLVSDLETIIVLVLFAFNFIYQRSHQSLTLPRPRIRDSATVTLTSGDGTTEIKVSHQHNHQLIFQNGIKSEVYRRKNIVAKTLPCGTTDTTLTSLLGQPSTITCCDRFD